MTAPDIFEYTDFREFLQVSYAWEKARNRRFSQRYIMLKVGASSSGWFSDVVRGRIALTGTFQVKLASLFQLKGAEEEYFRSLVWYAQAGSIEEKSRALEKILSFKRLKTDVVGQERFEYYGKWYYAAIRELLFVHDFRGDHADLAKRLVPPITPAQAKKAVALLEKLDFIAREADGRYRPRVEVVLKDNAFRSFHLVRFLKAHMELAQEALEQLTKEERDISALTLTFSPGNFEKARAEIKTLRKKLLAMSEGHQAGDRVYQCNFQLFPVTR